MTKASESECLNALDSNGYSALFMSSEVTL